MRRFYLLGLCLLLACAGCKKKDAPSALVADDAGAAEADPESHLAQVVIEDVAVELVDETSLGAYSQDLAKHVGRELAESGEFFALANQADPLRPTRRAHIRVRVSYSRAQQGTTGEPSHLAAVEVTATWLGQSEPFLRENLVGERLVNDREEPEEASKVITAHLVQTTDEACRGLIEQERLRGGGDVALVELLSSGKGTPQLLRFALSQLPKRNIDSAVDLTAPYLSSEHAEVREQAVATLVALGDPRGVDPLTKIAEFADHETMHMVLEAVSVLGGQDAIDYLEFVAAGHSDPEVKARANKALERARTVPKATRPSASD